jgi:hypothetical protein
VEDMKAYLTIFDAKATELSAGEKDTEQLTTKMLEILPERSQGDFIVPMNLKVRYMVNNENGAGKE